MARLLLLGASVASLVGGGAAAQVPDRYHHGGSHYGERAAYGAERFGGGYVARPQARYQAPPWSSHYAYEASATAMWSGWSRDERSWRYEEAYDRGGYGYEGRDYRDCRCAPPPRLRPAEVHLRPGPVYMDRRPLYIEQPPVYIEQPPVYVSSPPVYVQGPPIYVESPPVYVEPPVVHLTPGPVHVAPPEVRVAPAELVYPEAEPPPPPPPPTHFGDLPPPDNIPPVAPPPTHNYRQEPGERG